MKKLIFLAFVSLFLVACGGSGSGNNDDDATIEVPTGLIIATNSIDKITLSWSDVSKAGFYEIYRAVTNIYASSTMIANPLSNTDNSYEDTELATNTLYYYWLKACNSITCSAYSSNTYATLKYTKLSFYGTPLTIQNSNWLVGEDGTETLGTKWSCVRDNNTGLVWEIKTDNGTASITSNIHHKDNTHRWGGLTEGTVTNGASYGDWNTLVTGSKNENLCGFNDWRVPDIDELGEIAEYITLYDSNSGYSYTQQPLIDSHYFPNSNYAFWSSVPINDVYTGGNNYYAHLFVFGHTDNFWSAIGKQRIYRNSVGNNESNSRVRLVR